MSDVFRLARWLDKRTYGNEISKEESQKAKDQGLVVVFGYSDDNMEFRGAIDDEVGCYDGGFAYLDSSGLIENDCDSERCPYFRKSIEQAAKIEAVWGSNMGSDFAWIYKTDIPHETFVIYDEDEQYCRGIVFLLAALDKDN